MKIKRFTSLLLALALIFGATTAFAADSTITFKGKDDRFEFGTDEMYSYTDTDLFDGFKDVMPGDELEELITIANATDDFDYINVYLKAVAHDEEENVPVTGVDVKTMTQFLEQLTMTVTNGTQLVYEGPADGTFELVKLGTLKKGEALALAVELLVPIELDSTYANRVGEVDWVIVVEGITETPAPDTGDSADLLVYGGIFGISVMALFVLIVLKKKRPE